MDQYAGRLLADRYRLPRTPSEEFELAESRAFDTASGQEVLVRQVPLPEVVDAETLDEDGRGPLHAGSSRPRDRATRLPDDPVVRRAVAAAVAAARLPDHPRLDQVFDVFVQGDGLWIVSELVNARPLAALLAEERLGPYRAAEVAADLLAALRIVHAHGWVHRNVTARTVLICEDGRAVLTGLAVGACEEVLCGYDPLPQAEGGGGPAADGPAQLPPGGAESGPPAGDHAEPGVADGRWQSPAPGPSATGPSAPGPSVAGPREGVGAAPGGEAAGAHAAGAVPDGQWWEESTRPAGRGPAGGSPGRVGHGAPAGGASGQAAGGAAEWWESVTRPHPAGGGQRDEPPQGARGPARDAGQQGGGGYGAARGGRERPGRGAVPPQAGQPWDTRAAGRGSGSVPAREGHGEVTARLPEQDRRAYGPGRGAPETDPQGPVPDAYQRWESGPSERDGAGAGRLPGPRGGEALPSSWDFEGGAYASGGEGPRLPPEGRGGEAPPTAPPHATPHGVPPAAPHAAPRATSHPAGQPGSPGAAGPVAFGPQPRPGQDPAWGAGGDSGPGTAPLPRISGQPGQGSGSGSAADRAARSGAIAAYRAGTQAGAAARGRPQGPGAPGTGPTELPGSPRPSHPVRTGWEPPPKQQQRPFSPQQPGDPGAAPPPDGPGPGQRPGAGREQGPRQGAAGAARPEAEPARGPAVPPAPRGPGRERIPAGAGRYRGPDTALAAERARQARIMTVGAVTERWAPEQAGPVYEHWRLAPPVGAAADFWALGALLFRAVQGYPPYPEESAEELTQAVCAEQPAFAEDCGALRPIIESLLRQDPTERPSAEELRGWLRSLLRSAPEPEVGRHTVTAPPALEPGRPADPRRLPILRRRGELVGPRRRPRAHGQHSPRRLGRTLLTLVLLGLAGAIAYVLAFMSDAEEDKGSRAEGSSPAATPGGEESPGPSRSPEATEEDSRQPSPEGEQQPAPPPEGFGPQEDPAGFTLTVPDGFQRQGPNGEGEVIYRDGDLEIVVVPGRDGTDEFGTEPMDYQLGDEPELQAFRDYQYATSSGLYETQVGNTVMAEGVFGWQEGGERLAYNRVMLLDGHYHVVMVRGPAGEEQRISEIYEVTAESYRWHG
ncbi:protein kinase [Streptomyces hoynatensis]|uniref:Protein kinase domain-containing protein n=1 Tax=Streptomyces hoynatensis TaxID=1141874 RepID=A0A3A9ZEC3_9ACTN|nr:protein kinase [Streptomyces hoynatensis]RKN46821.1 hypothetical protein D7294_00960 [Streptomyces hoynatensis]